MLRLEKMETIVQEKGGLLKAGFFAFIAESSV